MHHRTQSVAVIGSGLAGLSVSYMLSTISKDSNENAFDVHIYEKAASVGMDAASIELPAVGSRMDVPMRSFFPSYYPLMTALYDHLSIPYAWTESSMSYLKHSNVISDPAVAAPIPQSFPFSLKSSSNTARVDSSPPSSHPKAHSIYFSFFSHRLPFLRNTIPVPDIWTRNPFDLLGSLFRALAIAWDFIRLLVIAKWALARGQLLTYRYGQVREDSPFADMTLGKFFREYGFGRGFVEVFMVLLSGACTCSFSTLAEYPAAVILEYVGRSFPFGRMSFVTCGIGEVCERLSAPVKNVHVNSTIESVTRLNNGKLIVRTTDGRSGEYDYVIFATQANQAVKILSQSIKAQTALAGPGDGLSLHLEAQQRILERFRYERSLVVCHTDASLLPDDSRLWRCLNFAHAERCVGLERVFGLDVSDDDASDDDTSTNSSDTTTFGYDPRDVAMCTHVSTPAVGWNSAAAREGMPARAEKGEVAMSLQKGKAPFLQTTNPIVMPRAGKILSTTWFERVCVSIESMRGLDELDDVQGLGGVYFVGSYAYGGVPLLEGCVASAWRVTLRILERSLGREERSAAEKRWWWEEVEAGEGKVADEEGPRFVVERAKEAGLKFRIEPSGLPMIAWTDWQFFGLLGVIGAVVAAGIVFSVMVTG